MLDLKEAKTVRARNVGCKVKVNRHGFLAFHLFWNKNRSWEGTGLRDTRDNRKLVEAKAVLIGREIKSGTFDYLKWFPDGNRAEELRPNTTAPNTIGEYYRVWIERKKPPLVRPGLERDYKDHFKRYILPKFDDVTFTELTPPPAGGISLVSAPRAWLGSEKRQQYHQCKFSRHDSRRADGGLWGSPYQGGPLLGAHMAESEDRKTRSVPRR